MKKLFTLFAAMLIALVANAQTDVLQFCYADGTIIPEGQIITVDTPNPVYLEQIGIYEFESGVYVKNNSANGVSTSLTLDVRNVSGSVSVCLGTLCRNYSTPGQYEVSGVTLKAGSLNNLECHWSPALDNDGEALFGSCDAVLTLWADGIKCSTVRVVFIYGDDPIYDPDDDFDDDDDPDDDPYEDEDAENDPVIEGTQMWGYVSVEDIDVLPYGRIDMSDGRYDVAMFVPGNVVLKYAKICGIWLPGVIENMANITIWASTELGGERIVETEFTGAYHPGYVTVPFDTEIDIPVTGLYIGYSFDLKIDDEDDLGCIAVAEPQRATLNGLFWGQDNQFSYQGGGRIVTAMQLFVKGMKQVDNAATVLKVLSDASAPGQKSTLTATISSDGNGVESIGYTLTVNGESTTGEYTFAMPVESGLNQNATFSLNYDLPQSVGTFDASLAINTVNGQPNEAGATPYSFLVSTVARIVPRLTVVEEYTGTGCQNCPRGWVGMEAVKNQKSDKAVVIAWHNFDTQDAMYVADYADLGISSAPNCVLDRRSMADPYFGNFFEGGGKNILHFVDEINLQIPTVAVDVKGEFADDSHQQINVVATTEFLTDTKGYSIAFAITADGLTGSTAGWLQKSAYYDLEVDTENWHPIDPELREIEKFYKDQEWGTQFVELVYNDVLIASSYDANHNSLVPSFVKGKTAEIESSEYTIIMPTKATLVNALDYGKIYVTAIVIDDNGRIANAARVRVLDASEITTIADIQHDSAPSRAYNLQGQVVNPSAARGIYIRNGRVVVSK